jgi:DNA-binding HxlR family transcriptional regulator
MSRSYGDRCGIARALDVVGERWALLIVRDLLLGPKRFTDLRAGLPHVSPDVLSQRLRELERAGIARRGTLPPPAASRVYELTDRGRELEPIILALGRWGSWEALPRDGAVFSADSAVLALKSLFDAGLAAGVSGVFELRLGEESFAVDVRDRRLEVSRGRAKQPVATIETEPATLARVLWHGGELHDLQIDGSRKAARRFLRLFPLPSSPP